MWQDGGVMDGFGQDAKQWGTGCLLQLAVIGVLAVAWEERVTDVVAYAALLSLAVLPLRLFMRHEEWGDGWRQKWLGPGAFVLACVLAVVHPLETDGTQGEDAPEGPAAAAPQGTDDPEKTEAPEKAEAPAPSPPPADEGPTFEEALAELDELIGLEPVKEEVRKFANYVRVSKQREAAGLKVAPVSYHMVFTGNPGTGKTTVARIMAKIYRSLGILEKGHLVETDRSGLVGQYMGETAVKTNAKIDEALDGVLFVDEAYALASESGRDYGHEAIATLLKRMEDDRDRLVVIVAGYTKEMKGFIEDNSGLKSRFNRYIEFPDYTAAELAAMFRLNVRKNQYALSEEAEARLDGAMEEWTRGRDRNFGNGRWVRNLFEKAVERQAMRLGAREDVPSREELMTLTPEDLGME